MSWIDNWKSSKFDGMVCLSRACLNNNVDASVTVAVCLFLILCIPANAAGESCGVGKVWPASGSVTYPDQAVYGEKYKAIKTHVTFGPDAAFRANLDSEYPFYVIVVKHEGSGTAKAFEGNSRSHAKGRHSYVFTVDYRDYPQDEMELLIFAGKDYQTTRYKINVTYTTLACKE